MRNLILFDDETREALLPLTYTRPVSEMRVGILTIRGKWEALLEGRASWITSEYLTEKFPITITEDNLVISGSVLPSEPLIKLIGDLQPNEALVSDGDLIAARIPGSEFEALIDGSFTDEIAGYALMQTPVHKISRCWELFTVCGDGIESDFQLITRGRVSAPLPESNMVLGKGPVFLEEGARIEHCILNTESGPVYLGKNALVMEGSMLRGPVAIGEGAVVKMGAKIYGPSSFGPYCKIGGEVNNSVMLGYSNKSHEGFLGNSVLGEWCNVGADTNTSNLKNTYGKVRLWSYITEGFEDTGLQFCGLIMGDHAKCGINTMFNTGTVVGVGANIFGTGYPEKFIPSFAWGTPEAMTTYDIDKAVQTAGLMMSRRNVDLSEADVRLMRYIHAHTAKYRSQESA